MPGDLLLDESSELGDPPLEISAEGIFILQDGRVKECNRFLADQAGYGMDEVEGTCFASFFDRASIETVEAVCGQISALQRVMSECKVVLLCKNGNSLDVQLRAGGCLLGRKPAVRVTLTILGGHAADGRRGADLGRFFVSEHRRVTRPACT